MSLPAGRRAGADASTSRCPARRVPGQAADAHRRRFPGWSARREVRCSGRSAGAPSATTRRWATRSTGSRPRPTRRGPTRWSRRPPPDNRSTRRPSRAPTRSPSCRRTRASGWTSPSRRRATCPAGRRAARRPHRHHEGRRGRSSAATSWSRDNRIVAVGPVRQRPAAAGRHACIDVSGQDHHPRASWTSTRTCGRPGASTRRRSGCTWSTWPTA